MNDLSRQPLSGEVDAVVVGAGFGGLYMLHRLRLLGLEVCLFEAGGGVGGTWYFNRYPGARCDVESLDYSYGFDAALEQEWQWTERYAAQPEILAYLDHVADRFELREDIRFNTRVTSAIYDESAQAWTVSTDCGDTLRARFCIMATGCLSAANMPEIPGRDDFGGALYHTGRWPHEAVDFSGQRVGVIGTGSSGIQSIPVIAEQCEHLTVFQRTPNFSVPANNHPLDAATQAAIKARYQEHRAELRDLPLACFRPPGEDSALRVDDNARAERYEDYWEQGGLSFLGAYSDLLTNAESNVTAAEFVRDKIRGIVSDPDVAEMLCPDHVIGCKRPCSDTGYYETFNRDNVRLVDLKHTPITRIEHAGVRLGDELVALDMLVFATGFDAMTGALNRIDIRGRDGLKLRDKWAPGPRTYLGLGTAGFPNLFTVTGPGSPSVLANMVTGVEHHAEWIAKCIDYLRQHDYQSIEATTEAEDAWVEHVNKVAAGTLYPTCNSWYMGANIPGKPRIFLPYIGGFPRYTRKCAEVADNGYAGFAVQ